MSQASPVLDQSQQPQGEPAVVLEVRNLSKHYGDQVALDEVSLTVHRGEIFGLLGPNGSGKTTTLTCALGLLHPSSGSVHILGQPSQRICETEGKVAVVFDTPVLLPQHTIDQNLTYGRRLRGHGGGRQAEEVLELVGLGGLGRRRANQLSLGQTRRLSIALALAGAPEFLVLDEPLAGLDPIGVREIMGLMGRLRAEGLTLLVSSHRLFEMERLLTHAAVLIEGRLAALGSMEELLGAEGRVRVQVDSLPRAIELAQQHSWQVLAQRDNGLTLNANLPTADVNRILVEAKIGVSSIAPARSSLPDLFEQLVDAHHPIEAKEVRA